MAADIGIARMSPMRFLESRDRVETMVMIAITRKFHKRRRAMDRELATEIVNVLGQSLKKG
jgi:ribosomal protein L17